jgi:hypothetical protein
MTINPPLYIVSTRIHCWKCSTQMPAISLVAPDIPEGFDEVYVLSDIENLPREVLAFIHRFFPHFVLRYSKTTRSKYFANTCPSCHMLSGDFHLHCEPGATFCPETPKDAKRLWLKEIPLSGPVDVEASPGAGAGELIIENARR